MRRPGYGFPENVVKKAWENAEGCCECRIRSHEHQFLGVIKSSSGRIEDGMAEAHGKPII